MALLASSVPEVGFSSEPFNPATITSNRVSVNLGSPEPEASSRERELLASLAANTRPSAAQIPSVLEGDEEEDEAPPSNPGVRGAKRVQVTTMRECSCSIQQKILVIH